MPAVRILIALLVLPGILPAQEPPAPDTDDLMAEANRRFERGDFQGAVDAFEVILGMDPDEEGVRFRLARAYHELGDSERFHATVRGLLARNPERADVFVLLGRRFQKEGSFPDAERAYRRALELKPEDLDALSGLAEVCLAQGFRDEGLEHMNHLLERYPDNVPLLWMMARSVEDREQEKELYERILQASPRGDDLAQGRLKLLQAREDREFFQIAGLEKPESVRLFFIPPRVSKAQFVDQEPNEMGGYRRRATPNTPYVKAKVNGTGPYKFLVDTGTQGIHLSRKIAERLGLETFGASRFEGLGLSDTVFGEIVFLDSLQLDGMEVRNLPVETIDLVGIGDGILNPAALRDLRVQLSFSRRALVFSRWPEPGDDDPLRPRADARLGPPVRESFLSFHGHMVIRVEIQGLTANALIDTGAESTVLDTSLVERLPSLESYDAASYGVSLEGITGEVVEARVVREAQLVVANRNLRITNLFAADLRRLANFYGPEIHAILGMRQLREFDLTFDFRSNDVIFQKILH